MEYTKQQMHEDFVWFKENYLDIYRKYGKCVVSIRDKKIIGVFGSVKEALDNTNMPKGTYSVQRCTGDIYGYTVFLNRPIHSV